MKLIYTIALFLLTINTSFRQNNNPNYNEALATKLGADDYGMKKIVLVILKTGNNTNDDKTKKDSCFTGHMTNIKKLVKDKKLIIAGPIGKTTKRIEEFSF